MSLLDLLNNLIKGDLAAVFANPNPSERPDRIVDPPAIMAVPDQAAPRAHVQPNIRRHPIPNLGPAAQEGSPAPVQPTIHPKIIPDLGPAAPEVPAAPGHGQPTVVQKNIPVLQPPTLQQVLDRNAVPKGQPQAVPGEESTRGQFTGDLKEAITTANSLSAEEESHLRYCVKEHQATIARLQQELKSLGGTPRGSVPDLHSLEQQEQEGWKRHADAQKAVKNAEGALEQGKADVAGVRAQLATARTQAEGTLTKQDKDTSDLLKLLEKELESKTLAHDLQKQAPGTRTEDKARQTEQTNDEVIAQVRQKLAGRGVDVRQLDTPDKVAKLQEAFVKDKTKQTPAGNAVMALEDRLATLEKNMPQLQADVDQSRSAASRAYDRAQGALQTLTDAQKAQNGDKEKEIRADIAREQELLAARESKLARVESARAYVRDQSAGVSSQEQSVVQAQEKLAKAELALKELGKYKPKGYVQALETYSGPLKKYAEANDAYLKAYESGTYEQKKMIDKLDDKKDLSGTVEQLVKANVDAASTRWQSEGITKVGEGAKRAMDTRREASGQQRPSQGPGEPADDVVARAAAASKEMYKYRAQVPSEVSYKYQFNDMADDIRKYEQLQADLRKAQEELERAKSGAKASGQAQTGQSTQPSKAAEAQSRGTQTQVNASGAPANGGPRPVGNGKLSETEQRSLDQKVASATGMEGRGSLVRAEGTHVNQQTGPAVTPAGAPGSARGMQH